MEKYRAVEKPKVETEIKENEIRITTQGKMRNFITYATTLFKEKGATEVVLKAMGRAINKTVTIAEIIKRRIAGLHQITVIDSTDITDVWEPLEEGLDRLETTRHVSSITISLSTVPLDTSAPGYQPPLPEDQVKEMPPPKVLRRNLPRGNGRGRGRGRGKNRGGMAPFQQHPHPQQQQPQQQQPQQQQEEQVVVSRGGSGRGKGRGRRPRRRGAPFFDGGDDYSNNLQGGGVDNRMHQGGGVDNRMHQGGNSGRQGNVNGGGRPQGPRTFAQSPRQPQGPPRGGGHTARMASGSTYPQQTGNNNNNVGSVGLGGGGGRGRGRRPRGRGRGWGSRKPYPGDASQQGFVPDHSSHQGGVAQ